MLRRTALALAFLATSCSTGEASTPDSIVVAGPQPTVPGVGVLPDTVPIPDVSAGTSDSETPTVSVVVTRPVGDDGVLAEAIAQQVGGDRVLVIGDSILASTARRYGRELCDALNPQGWDVAVDAEPGRFVEFGNRVLRQRLPENVSDENDFDAAVVHLGSNYGEDRDEYFEELNEILFRLAPRPTLLLTVTEYRPAWAQVNDVIDELSQLYDNVTVVDWERIARTPGVLSRDGLHPGEQGEAVLVEQLAVAMGAVDDEDGECLFSPFTDDSAVGGSGGGGSGGTSGSSGGGSSTSGGSSSGSTSTTGGTNTTGTGPTGGTSTGTGTTGGETSGGTTTDGDTSGGETTGGDGTTTDGETTGGSTTDGSTSGADTTGGGTTGDGGSTSGDTTTGGDTTGGETTGDGGSTGADTTGGTTTDGGSGGTTGDAGSTTGATTGTGGTATTGGGTTAGEGSTTGGGTTGGDTTGGAATTGTGSTTGDDAGGSTGDDAGGSTGDGT